MLLSIFQLLAFYEWELIKRIIPKRIARKKQIAIANSTAVILKGFINIECCFIY